MKLFNVGAALLASLTIAACAPGSSNNANPMEADQDFGPGFFDSSIDTTAEDKAGGETNTELPTPEMLETIERENLFQKLIAFPQTSWNECKDTTTGNYQTYACTPSRSVATIFDNYLQNKLIACVDAGLDAQGGGTAEKIHLTHNGVTADARHSPKSLHSYNRAIDIKLIKVELTNGQDKDFTYAKLGNRPFYTALRKCWGKVVHDSNGCPYYGGNQSLTGSIGWENKDHGQHMHLSVPYCVAGKYGAGLWVR